MKNNNGFWRKASVIITIIGIGAAALIGYGILCNTVKNNKDTLVEIKPKVQTNSENIKGIEAKLDGIQMGIDDIKLELRER